MKRDLEAELIAWKDREEHLPVLFIDEIQHCPEALLALRYFKKQMPSLHVIAASSLLEFLLKEIEPFGGLICWMY